MTPSPARVVVARRSPVARVALVALLIACAAVACRRTRVAPQAAAVADSASGPFLAVHRADAPPKIDGALDEPSWSERSARTGAFVGPDGRQARPYSDARLLWHAGTLDLALYAADQDLRPATDAFVVVLAANGKRATLRFGPRGLLPVEHPDSDSTALAAGATVAVDLDGSIDDPSDDDEEWVVEASLPLAPLGLQGAPSEALTIAIERCDTPKGGATSCAHFGTVGQPRVLRLQ